MEDDDEGAGGAGGAGNRGNRSSRGKISVYEAEARAAEEEEMRRAVKEVERLRLEMQRASERLEVKGETVVGRKKKRRVRRVGGEGGRDEVGAVGEEGEKDADAQKAPAKKKKKKKAKDADVLAKGPDTEANDAEAKGEGVEEGGVKKKKKKRRVVTMEE